MAPTDRPLPRRLRGLSRRRLGGRCLLIAESPLSRLLGLALLADPPAIEGLLIPGCRSIHTFGMRFDLRVIFIDERSRPLLELRRVGAGRVLGHRDAAAVIEIPIDDDGGRDPIPPRVIGPDDSEPRRDCETTGLRRRRTDP